jgi:hypothetical protein
MVTGRKLHVLVSESSSFKFSDAPVMNLQLDRVCGCHCGG